MSKKYVVRRRLIRIGNSLAAILPKIWLEREGLREGHELEVYFDSFDYVKVAPKSQGAPNLERGE